MNASCESGDTSVSTKHFSLCAFKDDYTKSMGIHDTMCINRINKTYEAVVYVCANSWHTANQRCHGRV